MPSPASVLRSVRLLHLYLGIFIAPSLLFFAFTGALQTFSLHETTRGSSYVPPRWAVVLSHIHKDQTAIVPVRKPGPPEAKPTAPAVSPAPQPAAAKAQAAPTVPPAQSAEPTRHPLPLKIFFLLVSVGLFTSTVTGIYMAYKYNRGPLLVTSLLVAGTLIPIALLFV